MRLLRSIMQSLMFALLPRASSVNCLGARLLRHKANALGQPQQQQQQHVRDDVGGRKTPIKAPIMFHAGLHRADAQSFRTPLGPSWHSKSASLGARSQDLFHVRHTKATQGHSLSSERDTVIYDGSH